MLSRAIGTFTLAAVALAAPAAAQEVIQERGTVLHSEAATAFPARIGEFVRVNAIRYDAAGHDISAEYRLERGNGNLFITVYVYPAEPVAAGAREQACRAHFDGAAAAITARFDNARLTRSAPPPAVPQSVPALSHHSAYALEAAMLGRRQALHSELDLYCYVGDRWMVKYRATANLEFPVAEAVETFIRSGPWPGRRPPDSVAGLGRSGAADAVR